MAGRKKNRTKKKKKKQGSGLAKSKGCWVQRSLNRITSRIGRRLGFAGKCGQNQGPFGTWLVKEENTLEKQKKTQEGGITAQGENKSKVL